MSDPAYVRAVAQFEALIAAPTARSHPTPASLIQEAGLSVSSGYRHTAALEADGLLRRDATGVYLNGQAGLRVGLNAHGLGRLAPVIQPVLTRLRETTQHTAYLAFLNDIDVQIGPFTLGRATRRIRLVPQYRIEGSSAVPGDQAVSLCFVAQSDSATPRVHSLAQAIATGPDGVAILGLVTNPARPASAILPDALTQAMEQLAP